MSAPRPGWNVPRPERIPRPTPWPAAMALGTTLFAWGFVTSPVVLGLGLVLLTLSLGGWRGEIRHEHRQD
ncbi:MAG TPA: hypothetical protein VIY73_20570 [Polyangiaceae bacterium]